MDLDMKLKFNFNKRNKYKNICSIEGCNNSACGKYCNKHYHQIKRYGDIKTRTRFDKNEIIINDKFTERYPEQSARLREETGGYFTLDDLDCIKVKFEIEKPIGDLANKINFDLLNTFFNHQHEMTRSSNINKTTMKNILNDGRDISIAKLVEDTSLIIK